MLDTSKPDRKDEHNDIWELIPWYVNGTLSPSEKERVDRYLKTSPRCSAEVARQQALAKRVATEDPFDVPLAQSWKSLQAQIRAEQNRTGAESISAGHAGGNRILEWIEEFKGALMLSGAGLAACLVAAVVILPDRGQDYNTLTDASTVIPGTIKFQAANGMDDATLTALLEKHHLTLISGPSETGVYTASLGRDANATTVAHDLMSAPEILFAAPDAQP